MTKGLCQCGCGRPTKISQYADSSRGYLKGEPRPFVRGHRSSKRYRNVMTSAGRTTMLHRLRAERALGKPLPPTAVVHHADGSKSGFAPLVICQDQGYHKLLHALMRVKAAGGNPWTDKWCSHCRAPRPIGDFPSWTAHSTLHAFNCRSCALAIDRATKQRAKARRLEKTAC